MDEVVIALVSSISTVSLVSAVLYLSRTWIVERLKASIKHEYDLKNLELDRQKEIRLKGEVVADLLAEWIRNGGSLDYHQLNKLSFQAYIWLPKNLAEKLSNSLTRQHGSDDVRKLLKEIRIFLHDHDDGLESKHAVVFDEPTHYGARFNTSHVSSEAKVKPKPIK
jgi:hypothetical protein